jgi:hypothetical protein
MLYQFTQTINNKEKQTYYFEAHSREDAISVIRDIFRTIPFAKNINFSKQDLRQLPGKLKNVIKNMKGLSTLEVKYKDRTPLHISYVQEFI